MYLGIRTMRSFSFLCVFGGVLLLPRDVAVSSFCVPAAQGRRCGVSMMVGGPRTQAHNRDGAARAASASTGSVSLGRRLEQWDPASIRCPFFRRRAADTLEVRCGAVRCGKGVIFCVAKEKLPRSRAPSNRRRCWSGDGWRRDTSHSICLLGEQEELGPRAGEITRRRTETQHTSQLLVQAPTVYPIHSHSQPQTHSQS